MNEDNIITLPDSSFVDADLLSSMCEYLRNLHKSSNIKFKNVIVDMFGIELLSKSSFQVYFASKLGINYRNFKRSINLWLQCGLIETRGRPKLSMEQRQTIYDTWVDNAQPSTDNRNSRCQLRISLNEFEERFSDLQHKNIELHQQVNKRGRKNMTANRMISTTTVRGVQTKLASKGITHSYGSVINNKPFFITTATEKELSLCLCKLCINITFLFEPLMVRAKKDGDDAFQSVSSFFMHNATCPKSPYGYFCWNCVNRKCKECYNCLPANLQCMTSNGLVSVDKFETVEREYSTLDKIENTIIKKKTKLTDRVNKKMTYIELYKTLLSMRKAYMIHKYYVYND